MTQSPKVKAAGWLVAAVAALAAAFAALSEILAPDASDQPLAEKALEESGE